MTIIPAARRLHAARSGSRQRGFTLIEVLITVVIIGVLAAIAMPSYTSYTLRGNRSAAQAVMMDMASKQEQYLLVNRRYGTSAQLLGTDYTLPRELVAKYDFTVAEALSPEPTFLLTFTPKGSQINDVTLTLDNVGNKTPADKW